MTGKPIATIYARGGAYGPETGMESYDYQKSYLEHILGFIGFGDFQTIAIEGTLASPEVKEKSMEAAREQAKKIASAF
jgi:FMN-dependent NADH-azoreductase